MSAAVAGPSATWASRTTETRRLPYVAVVEVTAHYDDHPDTRQVTRGTGLLVDTRHVVTCFHVVHPRPPAHLCDDALPTTDEEPLPRFDTARGRRAITVQLLGDRDPFFEAEIAGEDDRDDLALLRLERPVYGIRAPIAPRDLPGGPRPAWYCSFERKPDLRFAFTRRELDPLIGTSSDGIRRSGEHFLGAQAGFSGGPIFVDVDGRPTFVGLAVFGGRGSQVGGYVAADCVRRFLRANHVAVDHDDGGGDHAAWCLVEGYAPIVESPARDLLAPHHGLPVNAERPVVHVGLHPITTAGLDRSTALRPGTDRLPAHVADRATLSRLLDRLATISDLPLRLPTAVEFERLCRLDPPAARVVGRPVTIADYVDTNGRLRQPPDGAAEWIEDRGHRSLCLFRQGEILRFDEPDQIRRSFAHVRCVVRTVFTPGRGTT